jgi:hypothetical protein
VLVLAHDPEAVPQVKALDALGFRIEPATEMPEAHELERYHAVVFVLSSLQGAAMLAARVRARRRFGRRALIALVPEHLPHAERRALVPTGFDDVLGTTSPARTIAARILRRLRAFPEHRCLLRPRRRTHAA